MNELDERYSRQMRLAEVGQHGQRRIFDAVLPLVPGPAGDVEREYLERAGVRHFRSCQSEPVAFAHARYFKHQTSWNVAHGAWLALGELRTVLGSETHLDEG